MKANHPQTAVRATVLAALVASGLVAVPAGAQAATQATYYVNGQVGNDSNDGSSTAPFRTIDHARQAVRSVNDNMTGDIIVNIAPGDYYLDETLTFGADDSGTNGHDVVYRSTGAKGSVHIIGGTSINSAWSPAQPSDVAAHLPAASQSHVFKTQLPAETEFDTLYVDGERAVTARTKNYEHSSRFPAADGTSDNEWLITAAGDQYGIVYGADLAQSAIDGLVYSQAQGRLTAQFVIWTGYAQGGSDWYQETIPIGSINATTKKITAIKDPNKIEVNRTHWTHGPGYRYFLQNDLSFLDTPGEYFLDETSRVLYYYPTAAQLAAGSVDAEIVYPTMQAAIKFKGDDKADLADQPVATDQVHNIVLDGLTVEKTDFADSYLFAWNAYDAYGMQKFPAEAAGSSNPSYAENTDRVEYHVGAITLTDANNIEIRNSHITDVGMNGIEIFRDNDSITIENNLLDYVGMGAINIDGGYPGIGAFNGNHTVTNNLIHDVGQLVGHQPGVTVMSSGGNMFSHLEIFNAPRRGILLNAGWMRNAADANFNPLEDMYTVDNDFHHIYIHHAQQDAGEDSALFGWILLNRNRVIQLTGTDRVPANKYNRFEQILIDNIGANPSMHDKNTVHGVDFVYATGLSFTDVKVTNPQSLTVSARSWQDLVNVNYNSMNEAENWTGVDNFDDSRMDYANIGLTASFPDEYRIEHGAASAPDDVYFREDFETSQIDTTNKWIAERGTPGQSTIYMSEGPFNGKKSFAVDPIDNPGGTLLTRPFSSPLNKVVTMQFFDKRIDRAYSDIEPNHMPNSFGRVDDGVTQQAIWADGRISQDYFVVRSGSSTIVTDVPRAFGWHEFKWDYTSGDRVEMFIDGTLVATAEATSFDFVSMGDPTGQGGRTFFDELVIYGGDPAPAPGNVVQPIKLDGTLNAQNFQSQSGFTISNATAPETGKVAGWTDAGDYLDYFVNVPKAGTYTVDYRVAVHPNYTGGVELLVDGASQGITTLPPTGGWDNWATVKDTATLTAGLHTIRLKATSNGWNFKSATFAYGGRSVPGRIQAESFDAMTGMQLVSGAEGSALGYIDAGDTLDYDVYIDSPAVYKVDYRVAGITGFTGSVQLLVDGAPVKTTSLPATGGWETWASVSDYVTLPAGAHILQLKAGANGWNLDWVEFARTAHHAVPSTIQAEDYDGMSGIQIEPATEGGKYVGYIEANDWVEYDVWVHKSSNYAIDYRVGVLTGYTGGVEVQVDGVAAFTTSLPSTGGWQTWTSVTGPQVLALTAGHHTLRLKSTSNGWNLNSFTVRDVGRVVPARVEAESYDAMLGIQVGDSIASEGAGAKNVGYIDAGDWVEYQLYVPSTGTYTVKYRVAVTGGYTGGVDFLVDGATVRTTTFPSTGGWQNWATVTDTLSLPAGQHSIRLRATSNGWNLNWFELAL